MERDPSQRKSPRSIALCTTKNEQDIVEPFIRHHIRLVDVMIVLNYGSSDATRDIICQLMREFDNIVLVDSWGFQTPTNQLLSRLMHRCQDVYRADYVFLLDTDEFLEIPDRVNLEVELARIPSGGLGLLPWKTYILAPQDWPRCTEDPPRSIRWSRTVEDLTQCKVVLRPDGASLAHVDLGLGSHTANLREGGELPFVFLDKLKLGHFPVRSRNQTLVKVVVGWATVLKYMPQVRQTHVAFQWRDNFDAIVRGTFPSDEELCGTAMHYSNLSRAIDWNRDITPANPPSDYERRYSTAAYPEALSIIAREWEQALVVDHGRAEFEQFTLKRPKAVEEGAGGAVSDWYWNNIHVDVPPYRWLEEKYKPQSVLHIGCGVGDMLHLLKHFGVRDVYGIDHLPQFATVLDPHEYGNIAAISNAAWARTYDWVVCTAIPEKVDGTFALRQPELIASKALKRIVFSAPREGQPGWSEASIRAMGVHLRRWRDAGWVPDLLDTLGMRAIATLTWYRRNLVVLKPAESSTGEDAIRELEALASVNSDWPEHQPGIRYGTLRD